MHVKSTKTYLIQDTRYSCFIIVIFLFLAALALRLPSLTLNSFWHDELYTVSFVLDSFIDKLRILFSDMHPPTFNILVYVWSLFWGKSELAMRILPALIGAITVPISFLIFRKCFDPFTAFTIAILTLFLPSHIYYSQELRMYSLAFLAAVVATGTLFLYLENTTRRNTLALAAACGALFAIHYVSIFYIVTIYFLAVVGIDDSLRAKLKMALNLGLPTFAFMLLNIPHFLYKRLTMTSFWPDPVSLDKVTGTVLHLFKGDNILATIFLFPIIVAVCFVFFSKKISLTLKIKKLVILSFLPLAGVVFVSLISPNITILIHRIILIFAPAIIVLAAVGTSCLPNKKLSITLLLLYSTVSLWWLYNSSYYTVPTKSDFRGVSKEISMIEKKHGKILLISLDGSGMWRHKYYFEMFGVKSMLFEISEETTDTALLGHIRKEVMRNKPSKIVLFSTHVLHRKDVIEIFDKHFTKERERIYTGWGRNTCLMIYSVP